MLAHKQEISCNGSGLRSPRKIRPTADIQSKADAFATTHWSLVLIAQGQSAAAEEALEELCRIYWRPLRFCLSRRQRPGGGAGFDTGFLSSCYSNVATLMQLAGRKDVCVRICWYRSNIFWEANDAGR